MTEHGLCLKSLPHPWHSPPGANSVCTYTHVCPHADSMQLSREPHPIRFVFPLQMSHTKGQPLMEPACPVGAVAGGSISKLSNGNKNPSVQCIAGAGAPFWLIWQSARPRHHPGGWGRKLALGISELGLNRRQCKEGRWWERDTERPGTGCRRRSSWFRQA